MPQIYDNQLDNGFLTLWKSDETLEICQKNAKRSGIIFPRGWNEWKNPVKQIQALLARQICSDRLGQPEIYYEQNGKPFLSCGRLSISHSQKYLALYYHTHQEIGIDVEEPHERIYKIANRFLHVEEKKMNQGIAELTAIWSVKESVFKKYGGKTAFYSENIITRLESLQHGKNQIPVTVHTETGTIEQTVDVVYENDYILAFTQSQSNDTIGIT